MNYIKKLLLSINLILVSMCYTNIDAQPNLFDWVTNFFSFFSGNTEETEKHGQKRPINEIEITHSLKFKIIPSLLQGDYWRCGYFATFNCLTIYNQLINEEATSLSDINVECEDKFEQFLQIIFESIPEIKTKYDEKEWLRTGDVSTILEFFLKQTLDVTNNISILEKASFNKHEFIKEKYILRNIENFRKYDIPQLVIFHENNHWAAYILTKCDIYKIDSLYDQSICYNNTIVDIHKYFTNKDLSNIPTIQEKRRTNNKKQKTQDPSPTITID